MEGVDTTAFIPVSTFGEAGSFPAPRTVFRAGPMRDGRLAPHASSPAPPSPTTTAARIAAAAGARAAGACAAGTGAAARRRAARSAEHTSELQSLMRISYAVFCLKTKT